MDTSKACMQLLEPNFWLKRSQCILISFRLYEILRTEFLLGDLVVTAGSAINNPKMNMCQDWFLSSKEKVRANVLYFCTVFYYCCCQFFFFTTGIIVFVLNTLSEIRDLSQLSRIIANRSDEGLMLETSAFKLFTVANLHFKLSW